MDLLRRLVGSRPSPEPLDVDARPAILVGVCVWAVLLVLAVVFRTRLDAHGRGWWVWTPVAGVVVGLLGLAHLRRRDRG